MIETKREVINGREWQCTQFSGTKNLDLFHSLSTVLAPVVARAVPTNGAKNLLDASIDLPGAVDTLVRGMGSRDEFRSLIYRLLANTHVDGKAMNVETFDSAFAGPRILDLAPVALFCIRTHFGDFSKLVATITSQFGPQVEETQEPPATNNDSLPNSEDTHPFGG